MAKSHFPQKCGSAFHLKKSFQKWGLTRQKTCLTRLKSNKQLSMTVLECPSHQGVEVARKYPANAGEFASDTKA